MEFFFQFSSVSIAEILLHVGFNYGKISSSGVKNRVCVGPGNEIGFTVLPLRLGNDNNVSKDDILTMHQYPGPSLRMVPMLTCTAVSVRLYRLPKSHICNGAMHVLAAVWQASASARTKYATESTIV